MGKSTTRRYFQDKVCWVCKREFAIRDVDKCFSCNNFHCKDCRFFEELMQIMRNRDNTRSLATYRLCGTCGTNIGFKKDDKDKIRKFIAARQGGIVCGEGEPKDTREVREAYCDTDLFGHEAAMSHRHYSAADTLECDDCTKRCHRYVVEQCIFCNRKTCYSCKRPMAVTGSIKYSCKRCTDMLPEWVFSYPDRLSVAGKKFGKKMVENLSQRKDFQIRVVLEKNRGESNYFTAFQNTKEFEEFLFQNWSRNEEWYVMYVLTPKKEIVVGQHLSPRAEWRKREVEV